MMKCKKCSHEGDPITTVEPFPAGSVQVDQEDRDAALARLAELEKQEPAYLLTPDGKCYAYGSTQPLSAGHADATLLKLYTAAGASPVEPSQAGVVEPVMQRGISALQDVVDTLETYGKYHDDEGEFTRYLSDLLQAIATPQAAAQPPAPSDTAIAYMTGYSDGKEWAQADMLRTIKELQASLAWITEYIRAAPPELEEAKKWLLVMDNAAAGAAPVQPSESAEHRDDLAKRKPEPAAETVGGLAEAVKAARGGDAPPAPMRRFA